MSKKTVTILDTTGIQSYVFNSNRLRENIGASHLVHEATNNWITEISQDTYLKAEVIYAGGGNALLLFPSMNSAIEFTKNLSERILREASGINLVAAHREFDWENESLHDVIQCLMKDDIEQAKQQRVPSSPLLGLGVTATCNSTQLPAVDNSDRHIRYDDGEETDSYLISTEASQKLEAAKRAEERLQELFKKIFDFNVYQFPKRTDQLGRSEGSLSYAAVIHADGNGMGKRFREYGEKLARQNLDDPAKSNQAYVDGIREFSKTVNEAGENALREVAKFVEASIEEGNVKGELGEFSLKSSKKMLYLPFRPLVYGGDDVTFICDGRIGIELAAVYLNALENQQIADEETLYACAGVCVVKTHYPFARAYQLSEELCREAKKHVKDNKSSDPDGFSALDWHLAASGLSGSISDIRDREYQVKVDGTTKHLQMRPVRLHQNDYDWRTWGGLTKVISQFQQGDGWEGRKNKVLALRQVLRQGTREAVQDFLRNYAIKNQRLPAYPEQSGQAEQLASGGWLNKYCGYFDAIEAMEFYLALKGDKNA
ncbi:hypothetical protein H6G20_05315 [Desertifilum sp. FACHB-1129]|uniref:Cas10/Cmr2 second palm domain-containing protein n=1 Tax=unclassified Desertifilum TaxID=2621682 RepID=UPI0016831091|nr:MULTISPECIES: hypothetical protein [unclassified Desertifilum]MBD2311102.1 hypothetical protein [Desertifilum sp. FACHB-1129]MBD2323969.1 hypothetical protein [Desertifilum sp. FACHB-866]MBD2333904.1 hypothetical protein [Desertifilum sp. FACHB-868]MDA0211215.1 hypothetical protein [Cyanobacteria bacterium FC1]